MRIALMTDGIYPYVIGGMQRHSFYLAKYFASKGHHVDLYHMNSSSLDIDTLDVFTAGEKAFISSHVIEFPSFGKMPGHYIRESYEYSRKVYAKYRKQTPVDFIYAKGFSAWELLNQKSKGVKFPPVGVNFHGYEMFQTPASFSERLKFALLLRSPVKFCLRHADYAFSYGGQITKIITDLGVPRSQVIEIPAGITADWMIDRKSENVEKGPRFLFVGRYERRKGLPELYAAIKLLPKDANATFTFIGDIPFKDRIADKRCHFAGAVTDAVELKKHYAAADVLLCPSRSEGMPNVILEAMASGLAVIATDVGAVSVLVNSDRGWLLKKNDPETLRKAMLEAINAGQEVLIRKGKSAVDAIRQDFLWEQIGNRTVQALESAIRV